MIVKTKLEALQLLETGHTNAIPSDIPLWDGKWVSGKNKVTEFNNKHSVCAICGINEPLIWHHVFTKNIKGVTSTSVGNLTNYLGQLLGSVHICPNCHYYIHQLNPFNGKQQ